jgi:hypothetical protein
MERELVRLDAQGKMQMQVGGLQEDFLNKVGVEKSSVSITGMAVDGVGSIYVSSSGGFLLKLAANGSLIGRLNGKAADETIYSVAIDGQGRIAWGYSDRLVITDGSGNVIGKLKTGSLGDMEFNLKGELVGLRTSPPQVVVFSFGP